MLVNISQYPLLVLSLVQAAPDSRTDNIQGASEVTQPNDVSEVPDIEQRNDVDSNSNQFTLTSEQLFDLAQKLAINGSFDEAIRLLTAIESNPNPEFRAEARARIARILVQKGDLRAASLMFQKLLDEKPDAAGARVELADVLLKLGDEGGAARQLQRAAAVSGLSDAVQTALGRITSGIRSNKKFIGNFKIGLAPDSNINNATQNAQINLFGLPFQLDEEALATSGIGLTTSLSGLYRKNIGKTARLNIRAGADGDFYAQSQFNDFTLSTSIGVEIFDKNKSISIPIGFGQRYIGQSKIFDFYSLAAETRFRVDRKSQIQFNAGINYFDYQQRTDLSGRLGRLSVFYERLLSPTLSLRIGANASENDTNAEVNDTKSIGGEITLGKDLGPITIFSRGGYSNTKGDVIFVPFTVVRETNFYTGEIGVILRGLSYKGLSPQLRFRRIVSDSNIPLFDFNSNRFEVAVTRTF